MRQFALSQLLLTACLIAILLSFLGTEGCGRKFVTVSDLAFSPDGQRLAVVKRNARDANVPLKCYLADVWQTVSVLRHHVKIT
jgi:hypothetical protein